ncbi:MAG TPA: SRPBCC domain-containing protein [Candidatus Limnocylindria bacterium]
MSDARVGRASVTIEATRAAVWDALVDPGAMTRYMPVDHVEWGRATGDPLRWQAMVGPERFDVSGTIQRIDAGRTLEYSYFDPITRTTRAVSIELSGDAARTRVSVSESLNDERERPHIEGGWRLMLANLKSMLEPAT